MTKVNEIVQRVESHYVGDDCVQVMVPYKSEIIILNKDGIIYSHQNGSHDSINNYVNDERRKQFPYSNIPTHRSRVGLFYKMNFTNQLFDFEEPYIRIGDNHIIESFAVKDKSEALLINKVIIGNRTTKYVTRAELEEFFKKNKNKFILYINDESISAEQYYSLASEEKIYEYVKKELTENVKNLSMNVYANSGSIFGRYLYDHPLFLDFVEQSIKNLDLKNVELDIDLKGGRAIIVNLDKNNISKLFVVQASFVSANNYKLDIVDLPVNKYTLEQLKNLSLDITKTKEPKISLKLNPGVSKQDIQEAKQMVKTLRK